MSETQPVEGRCSSCQQTRPLFRYEPDHNVHFIPVLCEWCDREEQPLLCTRCWGFERGREENAPMGAEELGVTGFLLGVAANAGCAVRQEAADGAVAATAQEESR